MDTLFGSSIFSFFLCEKDMDFNKSLFNEGYVINRFRLYTDTQTPLQKAKLNEREILIFGYATDVFNGEIRNLASEILLKTNSLDEVVEYESHLGGKYVIFYFERNNCYCIGDATCSVPVFYCTQPGRLVCCSNPKWITDLFDLSVDPVLQKIRDSGPLNQAMPFDITQYKEVKRLIPNHYLDLSGQSTKRFVNFTKKQKTVSPSEAAKITAPFIENITKMYLSAFKIYCPTTSGRDSRVVLAFLRSLNKSVNTYTIWFDRFIKDDQDWTVPLELEKLGGVCHKQLQQEKLTGSVKKEMDSLLGENMYPDEALTLSLTVNKNFGRCAAAEGDIIGQVGKCSLHRDVPDLLATPKYFRCKLHNYSNDSAKLLAQWKKEINSSGEKVNAFDLFSIENRLGVWASYTHLIRNTMGMPFVNIFNSRSIIYSWTAVDRKQRMASQIHIELIKLIDPELLEIPFEKEKSGLINFAKSNWFVFYFATFAKYFVQKKQFLKQKKKPVIYETHY